MSSIQSVVLYGAEVWADALGKEVYRKRLAASAYCTVFEPAVVVIAGVITVVLLAKERQAIYKRREMSHGDLAAREERHRNLDEWQLSCQNEIRGRWTARLIGNLGAWLNQRDLRIVCFAMELWPTPITLLFLVEGVMGFVSSSI